MTNRAPLILTALAIAAGMAAFVRFGFFSDSRTRAAAEWAERDAHVGQLDAQLKELAAKIQYAQGTSRCETDDQCRVLGLGAQICDRYKDFLVYSTLDANEPVLLPLVVEFNQVHEKLSNLSLTVGKCGVAPAPIRCIEKRCEADQR